MAGTMAHTTQNCNDCKYAHDAESADSLVDAMGLRETKKERTRQQIEAAAFRLFADRGFQATTVADIAAAADIAPRTFFAYFSSKEAVVFGDFELTFESIAACLRGRADGESTFDALRAWIAELIDEQSAHHHDSVRKC